MADPVAYFLTWHTYGTWLHGHAKGSVDEDHREFRAPFVAPDEEKLTSSAAKLVNPPIFLNKLWRTAVQAAILEVCTYRKWSPLALHVRTSHGHVVITSPASPEKVLNDFKAYATRRLRREKLATADLRVWSVHGSTRYVWNDEQLAEVGDYVVNRQGEPLEPLPIGQSPERQSEPRA